MNIKEKWFDDKSRSGYLSEYKEQIKKMRWSYSRLTSFEHCQYAFYLNYIVNDDTKYLSEGNFYAEVGIFVHEILAKIFNGELTLEEASQYYVDNFEKYIFYKTKKKTMKKTFELCADYFAGVSFDWLNDYEILGVEREVNFKIEGYNFVGYIDLLLRDKRDGGIVIVDHKSSPYPLKLDGNIKKNSRAGFETYKKQMYLYSYAVKEEYGVFPKEIIWNHFKAGGKFVKIPFLKKEYDKAVKWLIDTIHKIENEDDFKPNLNYFYCKTLCNFRNSCEYCKNADWR